MNLSSVVKNKRYVLKTLCSVLLFFVVALYPRVSNASSLYLAPSNSDITPGQQFTVGLITNTAGFAINSASAVIGYPTDLLDVVSVSRSGSIFSLWVEEPTFSNTSGTITFNGGVPTPGYNGTAGRIISITFKAKKAGTATVSVISGSTLANDGMGTDLLTEKGAGKYEIKAGVPVSEPKVQTPQIKESDVYKVAITSSTHPDENSWYSRDSASFDINLPTDASAIRMSMDRNKDSTPTTVYTPPLNKKDIEKIGDGTWYLHVQAKVGSTWGSITHYKLNIDTVKPRGLSVSLGDRKDNTIPEVPMNMSAIDSGSGIDRFEISINGGDAKTVKSSGSSVYTTEKLQPGSYVALITAVDKAGNTTSQALPFTVEAFEAPTITFISDKISTNEPLVIQGKTVPNATVAILVKMDDELKRYEILSDSSGNFSYVSKPVFKEGVYAISLLARDSSGAQSNPTQNYTLQVLASTAVKFGKGTISILSILVPAVALVLLLLTTVWYWWRKFTMIRSKSKKIIHSAEMDMHKTIDVLIVEFSKQISALEKASARRELTKEEQHMLMWLKENMEDSKQVVERSLEKISKSWD